METLTSAPIKGSYFILAGKAMGAAHSGAIFTLRVPRSFYSQHEGCADHYSYKVKYKPANDRYPESWMVSLLTGPDNYGNWSYIGQLNAESGAFRTTKGSKAGDNSWSVRFIRRIFACLWEVDGASLNELQSAGFELMHVGRCAMCGKRLTTPDSINNGLGPICAAKAGL